MLKLISKQLLLSLLVVNLSSCASLYDVKVEKPATYVRPVTIDNNFDISGRFLIKTTTKNKYGNFTWDKTSESEELDFKTPIGQTVAKIAIESGIVTLTTDKGSYTGEDLDKMMQEKLGFTFPLQYLHYWIQGVSLPSAPVTKELSDGFSQLGWDVEYLKWQDKNHPQIIQCTKGDLVIKLLIEW